MPPRRKPPSPKSRDDTPRRPLSIGWAAGAVVLAIAAAVHRGRGASLPLPRPAEGASAPVTAPAATDAPARAESKWGHQEWDVQGEWLFTVSAPGRHNETHRRGAAAVARGATLAAANPSTRRYLLAHELQAVGDRVTVDGGREGVVVAYAFVDAETGRRRPASMLQDDLRDSVHVVEYPDGETTLAKARRLAVTHPAPTNNVATELTLAWFRRSDEDYPDEALLTTFDNRTKANLRALLGAPAPAPDFGVAPSAEARELLPRRGDAVALGCCRDAPGPPRRFWAYVYGVDGDSVTAIVAGTPGVHEARWRPGTKIGFKKHHVYLTQVMTEHWTEEKKTRRYLGDDGPTPKPTQPYVLAKPTFVGRIDDDADLDFSRYVRQVEKTQDKEVGLLVIDPRTRSLGVPVRSKEDVEQWFRARPEALAPAELDPSDVAISYVNSLRDSWNERWKYENFYNMLLMTRAEALVRDELGWPPVEEFDLAEARVIDALRAAPVWAPMPSDLPDPL